MGQVVNRMDQWHGERNWRAIVGSPTCSGMEAIGGKLVPGMKGRVGNGGRSVLTSVANSLSDCYEMYYKLQHCAALRWGQ